MMLYYIAPKDTFSYKINIAEYYDQTVWHDTIGRAGPIYFYGQDTLQNVSMIMYLRMNDTLMKTYTVSEPLQVPAYHQITDLGVQCYRFDGNERKGAYEVTWKVKYPEVEDIMPSYIFEIQRASNWDFKDAVTVGSINFNSNPDPSEVVNNEFVYHFIDSTASVMKGDLNPVICYRVRRASSMMWDWDDSNILNQLKRSKVALWDYFDYNRSAGRIGNVVLEAGLDTLSKYRYVRKDADWATNRKVHIHASTYNEPVDHWLPEIPSYGEFATDLMNLYWHSEQVNFILVKRVITETDTIDTEIIIPKDSVKQMTGPYHGVFTTAKAFASSLGGTAAAAVGKLLTTWYSERKNDNPKSVYAKIFGSTYSFHFDPIVEFPSQQMGLAKEGNNKTAGFVLETASSGYESVQVYRLTDNDFNEMTEDEREAAYTHTDEKDNKNRLSADYVFLRKGGASRCPYEDAETTMFYQPGIVLSEATLKMDKPTITSNRHEISNVPADEKVPYTSVTTVK